MAARKKPPGSPARPKGKLSTGRKQPSRKASPAPRRPRQVPKAQWEKLGTTTRKRYAGFFKAHPKGTVQQARGHKEPREHRTRRQKELDRMQARASHQAWMGQHQGARSSDEILASYKEAVKDHGQQWFTRLDKGLTALTNRRIKEHGQPTGISPSEYFADLDLDDYDIDDSELFYGSEMYQGR